MRANDVVMEVDFAVFNGEQPLGILCRTDADYRCRPPLSSDSWSILQFSQNQLEAEFTTCLQEIMAMVKE